LNDPVEIQRNIHREKINKMREEKRSDAGL